LLRDYCVELEVNELGNCGNGNGHDGAAATGVDGGSDGNGASGTGACRGCD
jgi:hypothetical protein